MHGNTTVSPVVQLKRIKNKSLHTKNTSIQSRGAISSNRCTKCHVGTQEIWKSKTIWTHLKAQIGMVQMSYK
jgi:hypothetical protein